MNRFLSLLLMLFVAGSLEADSSCLRSGPMLGYAEMSEVAVWLQTHRSCPVSLRYWPLGDPDAARLSAEIVPSSDEDHIAIFRLTNLAFGTEYAYEVYVDGERSRTPFSPVFRTQAHWRWRVDPPPMRFAVGSCAYINEPLFDRPGKPYGGEYEIFDRIAGHDPQFMLWLGDNLYYREPDWLTESAMRRRFAWERAEKSMAKLFGTVHNYAIWDDHDFGPDDSDRSFRGRREALDVFRDYWANPSYGTPEVPGVFFRFEWADVEFFMLDDRYYRTPEQARPRQMFGEQQMQWLLEALHSSSATFKIVAAGSQLLNRALGDLSPIESWANFPEERSRFLSNLAEQRIDGVLFLTGDRHFAELTKIDRKDAYPLYELTTSPLSAGPYHPTEDLENPDRVPGTLIQDQRNYAILEVDGSPSERRLTMVLYETGGREMWRRSLYARDLRHALP